MCICAYTYVYVCIVCTNIIIHVGMCGTLSDICMWLWVGRPEVDVGCPLQSTPSLLTKSETFSEHAACRFKLLILASLPQVPLPPPSECCLELQEAITPARLLMWVPEIQTLVHHFHGKDFYPLGPRPLLTSCFSCTLLAGLIFHLSSFMFSVVRD